MGPDDVGTAAEWVSRGGLALFAVMVWTALRELGPRLDKMREDNAERLDALKEEIGGVRANLAVMLDRDSARERRRRESDSPKPTATSQGR